MVQSGGIVIHTTSTTASLSNSPSSSLHDLHRIHGHSPLPKSSEDNDHSGYADLPLTVLSKATRRQLSNLLNSRKILRSEEGYERDWRGLALLAEQKCLCDESILAADDPVTRVLQLWCSNNPKTATFGNLERYLGYIDRWDVCDDIYENLVKDAKLYNTQQTHKEHTTTALSDGLSVVDGVPTSGLVVNAVALNTKNQADADFGLGSDANILTKDDVLRAQRGLPPQMYDAFVLFAETDLNYAVELLTKLEDNPDYSFKLCLRDRDLLAGVSFAHVALTQLIEERCKHLIVILTEDFIKSPENKFLVNYTQALQIQSKTRKIIPLLYEDSVVIPRTLKIYTHLKYNASACSLFDFWDKLADSIRNVNISTDTPPSIYTKELHSTLRHPADPLKVKLSKLPTPPTEIPSININGSAFTPEEDPPKKKQRNIFKKVPSHSNTSHAITNKHHASDGLVLRNAHSTSQLNGLYRDSAHASLSNLSTTSTCSEPKKKKKWSTRLLRKVFSRSSARLQETA